MLVIPFTAEFAATPPEEFVLQLHAACRPLREICVGHEWSFGRGRAGNLEMLRQMGDRLGFDEVGVPAVEIDGEIVSSTAIRRAVETGDLPARRGIPGPRLLDPRHRGARAINSGARSAFPPRI